MTPVRQCTVEAATWWGSTGIQLLAGRTYQLEAAGKWFDADIPAGPDGYAIREKLPAWKRPLFRIPAPFHPLDTGDRWYMLLGRVGERGRPFEIATGCQQTVTESGLLYATVNDLRCAYGNNAGHISLHAFE